MHVLPLPFGMALALLPRREAPRLAKPRPIRPTHPGILREQMCPELRYADLRQLAR
jgi:hypothetical protein